MVQSIFQGALSIMIPVLFAACGGLFPALAGTLNIALEGMLLAGAFASFAVYNFTGSITAALIAAVMAAVFLSFLHVIAAFKLRANIFICGIAVNLLSVSLCIVMSDKIFNTRGVVTLQSSVHNVPSVSTGVYLFFAALLVIAAHIVIYKTPFGYRLRACEKNSPSLVSLGINPETYRTAAILISAVFCGIGGSFLSLNLGAFVQGMSAGKGWIALVLIFLGGHKPAGLLAAAFIFGMAESFSNHIQGIWRIPADFILAFPYFCTLAAMLFARKLVKIE
ncbi:MAG: ABC transporter permease [Treponema sp.]|nr:ABC transporter permease [Treponema sp.]